MREINRKKLDLLTYSGKSFYYFENKIESLKLELDSLVHQLDYMHNRTFVKKVLFPYEVKFNNAIEEYNDDISLIKETINNRNEVTSEQTQRILNLYNGYKYILRNNITINKDNLKHLYTILSKDLIKMDDQIKMGEYYRKDKVFITSSYLDKDSKECLEFNLVPQYMEYLFKYINTNNNFDTLTDYYIKSQIIHLYFVYIHPYFDINGRTSRTTSMWYLLNNKAYPYIIFNRGITMNRKFYCKVIEDTEKYADCTYFINYMLKTVIQELEKEYLIDLINESTCNKLDVTDFQSLQYIISTNSLRTVNDFASMYNKFNEKKHRKEILETMITPLIEKDVIKIVRHTNNHIYGNKSNFVFDINYDKFDIDKEKVKHLNLNI